MRGDTQLFVSLCVAIGVAVANGAIFCFALMVPALRKPIDEGGKFGFSITEVNMVSTIGVITGYCSLPTGQLYDRKGPRITLAVGTCVATLGYFLIFLIFAGAIPPSVVSVTICYGISQIAATFFETGSVLTMLEAFNMHQGRVVMIQKTFMGLGSSVLAMVYSAFFATGDLKWFFLFLCLLSCVAGATGAWLIRLPKDDVNLHLSGLNREGPVPASRYDTAFRIGLVVLTLNVVFLFTTDIVGVTTKIASGTQSILGIVAILLCLAFVLMLPGLPSQRTSMEPDEFASPKDYLESRPSEGATLASVNTAEPANKDATATAGGHDANANAPMVASAPAAGAPGEVARLGMTVKPGFYVAQNVHGLVKNVRLFDMWLVWYTCLCTWGAMAMVNTNTDEIYAALAGPGNYSKERSSVYVSIFGIASALGRIVVGAVHPRMNAREIPIWYVLPVASLVMAVGCVLFLIIPAAGLIVPFFVVGLATGVAWGGIVLVMKRLFKEPGRHYSFLYTAGMLTPILFSTLLFSLAFAHESRKQGQAQTSVCYGTACILIPMLICAFLNITSVAVGVVFCRRVDRGSLLAWDNPNVPGSRSSCLDSQTDSMLLADE